MRAQAIAGRSMHTPLLHRVRRTKSWRRRLSTSRCAAAPDQIPWIACLRACIQQPARGWRMPNSRAKTASARTIARGVVRGRMHQPHTPAGSLRPPAVAQLDFANRKRHGWGSGEHERGCRQLRGRRRRLQLHLDHWSAVQRRPAHHQARAVHQCHHGHVWRRPRLCDRPSDGASIGDHHRRLPVVQLQCSHLPGRVWARTYTLPAEAKHPVLANSVGIRVCMDQHADGRTQRRVPPPWAACQTRRGCSSTKTLTKQLLAPRHRPSRRW